MVTAARAKVTLIGMVTSNDTATVSVQAQIILLAFVEISFD